MSLTAALRTALLTFLATNLDDLFVLVTLFAEASSTNHRRGDVRLAITPLQVTIGQYCGFTVILGISMLGSGLSLVVSPEAIGFLGLVPMLLGVWMGLELMELHGESNGNGEELGGQRLASKVELSPMLDGTRRVGKAAAEEEGKEGKEEVAEPKPRQHHPILRIATLTILNGVDTLSSTIPLFAQATSLDIMLYIAIAYVLRGVWCIVLVRLVLRQQVIQRFCQRYARFVIPGLYAGLGVYVVVKSGCYGWAVARLESAEVGGEGAPAVVALVLVTGAVLAGVIAGMVWLRGRRTRMQASRRTNEMLVDSTVELGIELELERERDCDCTYDEDVLDVNEEDELGGGVRL